MKQNFNIFHIFKEVLPIQILIPVIALILVTFFDRRELIFIPLIVFVIFNLNTLKDIVLTIKRILTNSKIFDIN